MTRQTFPLALALLATAMAGQALAQGTAPSTPPTTMAPSTGTTSPVPGTATTLPRVAVVPAIDPMKIDLTALSRGMRTSKVVGMSVVNDANETLGTIDDLIVMPNETVPYAVLSVGGFLGMGAHYVVVPYGMLEMHDKKLRLPRATKESLKALPSYTYPA